MTREEVKKLLDLPAEERLEIAQVLWNSVEPEDEARYLSLPDWQRRILEERLADLDRNPDDEQPCDEIKEELWPGEQRQEGTDVQQLTQVRVLSGTTFSSTPPLNSKARTWAPIQSSKLWIHVASA